MIRCKECGKLYKALPVHIKMIHRLTVEEYRNKYPNAPLVCEEEKDRLRSIGVMTEETKQKLSTSKRGKHLRPEHKKKISLSGKGRVFSEEHKKNLSLARKGKTLSDEHKKKLNKPKIMTESGRRSLQKSVSDRVKGSDNPMYGKSPIWKSGIQYTCRKGREFIFRSTWEKRVAEYLDTNNMEWDYEYMRFDLLDNSTYMPDFFILDKGKLIKLIEVKGWMTEEAQRRIDRFKELYPIPLEVWTKSELIKLGIKIK